MDTDAQVRDIMESIHVDAPSGVTQSLIDKLKVEMTAVIAMPANFDEVPDPPAQLTFSNDGRTITAVIPLRVTATRISYVKEKSYHLCRKDLFTYIYRIRPGVRIYLKFCGVDSSKIHKVLVIKPYAGYA